jgi:hypothetical protein
MELLLTFVEKAGLCSHGAGKSLKPQRTQRGTKANFPIIAKLGSRIKRIGDETTLGQDRAVVEEAFDASRPATIC